MVSYKESPYLPMFQPIYSLELEKLVLASILRYSDFFYNLDGLVTDREFFAPDNKTIYNVIKSLVAEKKSLDCAIVAERIKNLKITFKDGLNPYDYLTSLSLIRISEKGAMDAAKELVQHRIRREITDNCALIAQAMHNSGNLTSEKIISLGDKMYNEKIVIYDLDNNPKELYTGLVDMVEERAKAPRMESGLVTPYKIFNDLYGGFRDGDIYAICSRPKAGKSTWLGDVSRKTTIINPDVEALILDTEMHTEDNQWRAISAISGVPMWWLENGTWRLNKELYNRWQENKSKVASIASKVYHINVAGKPVNEVASIIQRWYLGVRGRGKKAIIVYDYIKLTGEDGGNKQEHQLIGDKINTLKELCLKLNIPLLTACQLNRFAEEGRDDSSAIAQSDRLQWFASFVAIFRKMYPDELLDYGTEWGTHKMIALATRFQGKNATGHNDLVKIKKPKGDGYFYVPNFITFKVENFNVEEKGTLEDIMNAKQGKVNVMSDDKISAPRYDFDMDANGKDKEEAPDPLNW